MAIGSDINVLIFKMLIFYYKIYEKNLSKINKKLVVSVYEEYSLNSRWWPKTGEIEV